MSSNRLLKSQLLRRLSELKKSSNFPVKRNDHPAILYVESVLKPESLSWAPAQRRGSNLNMTAQRAISAWPQMDYSVKGLSEMTDVIEYKMLFYDLKSFSKRSYQRISPRITHANVLKIQFSSMGYISCIQVSILRSFKFQF